jgi:hypothetical protein
MIGMTRAEVALDIQNFMALYWEEVEKNEGRRAADHFAEGAIFDAKMVYFEGRQQIRDWFAWREGVGRTARHLLSNLHFDFSAWEAERVVDVKGVMTHFAGDGKGILPIGPPIAIYDYRMILAQGGAFEWTIRRLETYPVFVAPDHVALRYAEGKS